MVVKEEENISMWSPTNLSPLLLIIVGRLKLQLKKKEERLGRRGQKALALQPIAQLTLQIFNETKKTFTAAAAAPMTKCFHVHIEVRNVFALICRFVVYLSSSSDPRTIARPVDRMVDSNGLLDQRRETCTSRKSIERDGTSVSSHRVLPIVGTLAHIISREDSRWMKELQNNRLIAYSLKELGDKETIDRLQSEINPYHDLPR